MANVSIEENALKGGDNMDKVTNENYLQKLFIDEVEGCLKGSGGDSEELKTLTETVDDMRDDINNVESRLDNLTNGNEVEY